MAVERTAQVVRFNKVCAEMAASKAEEKEVASEAREMRKEEKEEQTRILTNRRELKFSIAETFKALQNAQGAARRTTEGEEKYQKLRKELNQAKAELSDLERPRR